jgi:2-keto-4-pentenoate hydratase
MLADCIANAGLVVGSQLLAWRTEDLRARAGRLMVDGKLHVEGKSVDPLAALQLLPPAMAARGKSLAAGQIIITGSLIGMNWLTGNRELKGIIDDLGEVAIRLAAA